MKDRWLQWNFSQMRNSNCIGVGLTEYVKGLEDKWALQDNVGFELVKIRFWDDETSICRKLNQTQEKLLKRYVKYRRLWDVLGEKVLPNFVGGKIVVDDRKTNELIRKFT